MKYLVKLPSVGRAVEFGLVVEAEHELEREENEAEDEHVETREDLRLEPRLLLELEFQRREEIEMLEKRTYYVCLPSTIMCVNYTRGCCLYSI